MNKIIIILALIFANEIYAYSQTIKNNGVTEDESELYASTKQINQFFRRFNGEEDLYGEKYYQKDSLYRNINLRKRYLSNLFDNKSEKIEDSTKKSFIKYITKKKEPLFLDFYSKNWIAEVSTKFKYKGKKVDILIYFKIEKQKKGYKWIITNVYSNSFDKMFFKNDEGNSKFLHPMSHELDFMNINKIFRDKKYIEYYTVKGYKPDYLTLFLFELKKSNLKFVTITKVKFHIFQIKNWYFEIYQYNRKGYNSGWLISNIFRIEETEKTKLIKLISHDK